MSKFKHEFNIRAGNIEHQICLYLQDDDSLFLISGPTPLDESKGIYVAEFVESESEASEDAIKISTKYRSYSEE